MQELEQYLTANFDPPEEEEEFVPFTIDDDDKATWALRILAVNYREQSRLSQQADREIARIEEWKEINVGVIKRRAENLESQLEGYFRRLRDEGFAGSTYKLPTGSLKRNAGRLSIAIEDEDILLKSVKDAAPEIVETKETVTKTALAKLIRRVGEGDSIEYKLATDDGTELEGATVNPPRETYKAVPVTTNEEHE